ncbi:MAG: GNAT family N-acetyltransferase [Bdellovibrionales bacterium]|nr:GNAT family N-acetyltransferase [Bdellovibrionales bacterium]
MKFYLGREQDWELRPLLEADISDLSEIVKTFYSQNDFPVGGGWGADQLADEVSSGHSLAVFYRYFGLTCFVIWREVPGGIDIRLLGTHPQWRRRGMMKHLMRQVIDHLKGGEELWLEAHEANLSARNLYERLGFSQVGSRPRYYRDGAGASLYSWCCP